MKKVWIGLSVICLGIGAVGVISDLSEGAFGEDTVITVLVMAALAAFFGYLAWLWRIKSPVKRAGEQAAAAAKAVKERKDANKELSPALKWRTWKFRIAGILVSAFAVWMCVAGNWNTAPVAIATVVLIVGIALFMLGSPGDYNSMTDMTAMIAMDKPRKIGEFYEAFKNVNTPLGSAWLGKISTIRGDTLIFGPNSRHEYLYFWLTSDGNIGYLGYSFLDGLIKERRIEPVFPPMEDEGSSVADHLCYQADVLMCQSELKESFEYFVKTGAVLPIRTGMPSEVYTFTEDFKLTGQRFEVQDRDGNTVYRVEGTVPLIKLYIYDMQDNEIFRMEKEIGHALATYRFFYRGEPYGVLEKQFTLVRDKFAMELKEGRLELTEYAGSIGHNFRVTLNGEMLGAVMDNMDITIENVVFDNAFLVVYDRKYLPLMIAMAVMVARELARDEDGGLTNRTGNLTDTI